MTLGLGSPTGTPPGKRGLMEMPNLSSGSNKVKNRNSSPPQLSERPDKSARKLREEAKKRRKAVSSHSLSDYSGTKPRSEQSYMNYMNHSGAPLMAESTSYPRTDYLERSISREPDSILERAVESLEQKRKDRIPRDKTELLANAKDSIDIAKSSPKLKRSNSEAIKYSKCDADVRRYNKKQSSKKDSRKSKSSALVTKPNSKLMLINEKLKQSSLPGSGATQFPLNGKVFGFLFFKGKTGIPTDARVRKNGKKDRKEIKEIKSDKNKKDSKKKTGQQPEQKHTKRYRESKKSKNSSSYTQVKAGKGLPKNSEKKDRERGKGAGSKNAKTLCEFEISPNKKDSGLVVKVLRKHS